MTDNVTGGSDPAGPADDPIAAEERWIGQSIWFGRAIVLCAVVGTVAMLVLVQRFGQTYADGLEVTTESAELVADSVEPAKLLADDLSELAAALADGIDGTRAVLDTTASTLDAIGEASATNIADSADGAAGAADDLAGVLETIERFIPGNSESAAEELRTLADGLEPVADQLRELGGQLQSGAQQLGEADATLAQLSVQVDAVATGISDLGPSFDELEVAAADLAQRAADANSRVGTDLWLLRIVVIVLGTALACTGIAIERFARHLAQGSAFVAAD